MIAPSLESFRACLTVFRQFASGGSTPLQVEADPPSEKACAEFLNRIKQITTGADDAWCFWAVQIDIDPESYGASQSS